MTDQPEDGDVYHRVREAWARAAQAAKSDPKFREARHPLQEAVVQEMALLLIAQRTQDSGRTQQVTDALSRAVNNAYEDAKATCMERRPPCRGCGDAIESRQREVMGQAKPDSPPAEPIVPAERWGFGDLPEVVASDLGLFGPDDEGGW